MSANVYVNTSNSSLERTGTTFVCKSPSERATIRLVTFFTGREIDRANCKTSKIEINITTNVDNIATIIAALIK